MNKTTLVILLLLAMLVIPMASAQPVVYFKPADNPVPDGYGHTTTVEVWIDASQCASGTGVASFSTAIDYDPNCVKITDVDFTGCGWTVTDWNASTASFCWGPGRDWVEMVSFMGDITGDFRAFSLTFHCNNASCACCKTNLNFTDGVDAGACPLWVTNYDGVQLFPILVNGTLTCGSVVAEDFSKPLYEGWNLISLPLVPDDNSVSTVLSTASYDAVYRYNATSKQFESADTMNPGTGYFVYAAEDCTWEYSGTAYNSMSTSLEPGLNMVGWLNCSKDIDVLSSISGDYYYVAQWNVTTEKFEVYNPAAPSTFNDFAAMDRGTGYFISAKQDCTDCVLSENC